jgi:hypothetical protein
VLNVIILCKQAGLGLSKVLSTLNFEPFIYLLKQAARTVGPLKQGK